MTKQSLLVLVVCTAVVGLAIAVHGQSTISQAPRMPSTPPGEILVRVNGDIFTQTELETRRIDKVRRRSQPLSGEQLEKALVEATPEVLVAAVDEMLLVQRGKKLGFRVPEEQVTHVLESIRKENKLESDEAFGRALEKEGLDVATLRKTLERQLIVNQVQQVEVLGKLGVTEKDVGKKDYDAKVRTESDNYIRRLRGEAIIEWRSEEMRRIWIAKTSEPPPEQKG